VSSSRRARGTLGTVGLVAGLAVALPTAAQAATYDTTSASASTITLGSAYRSALRAQGVRISAGRPATLKGTRLRLPVTGSRTTSGSTTLTHTGTLTLRKGTRAARLTTFRTVVRSKTATVTAIVAKKRRTVFTISGGKVARNRTSGAVTVSGGTVRISAAAVRQLRSSLRASGLRTGVVGRLGTTVRPSPVAAPAAPAPVAPAPVTPAPTAPAPPTTVPTTPTTPTTPTDPASCALSPVPAFTDGATWGVKESFRTYLQGPIAHGKVTCDGGATGYGATGKATLFRFDGPTAESYDHATGALDATFDGRVLFEGHDSGAGAGPLLSIEIENPRVVRAAGSPTGTLYADVTSREFTSASPTATPGAYKEYPGVALGDLDFSTVTPTAAGGEWVFANVPATLNAAGAAAFAPFYEAGAPLDPITFRVADTAAAADRTVTAASTNWKIDSIYGGAFSAERAFAPYDDATGTLAEGFSYIGTGGSYNAASHRGTIDYRGRVCGGYVAIGSHDTCPRTVGAFVPHQIQLGVGKPTIALDGDTGTITADVFAKAGSPPTLSVDVDGRIPFATLDLSAVSPTSSPDGRTLTWTAVPAALTAQGASAYYQDQRAVSAGSAIDPITFSVTLGDAAPAD